MNKVSVRICQNERALSLCDATVIIFFFIASAVKKCGQDDTAGLLQFSNVGINITTLCIGEVITKN